MDEHNSILLESKNTTIVLPGDVIDPLKFYTQGQDETSISSIDKTIKLGPGLIQREDSIIATAAGTLKHNFKDNRFWVDFNLKRYVPSTGDSVIGVVTKKHAESFTVDIGGAVPALLSALAFEGATKKNKQNINVGDLIYAKVSLAHKDIEPEIQAFNPHTGRSEGFGHLKKGFAFKCSLGLCRSLLDPDCTVLDALGSKMPFEIAIGLNGCVWISGRSAKETILIRKAILNSESSADPMACQRMVSYLIDEL